MLLAAALDEVAEAAFFTEFSNIIKFFAFSLSYRDVSELLLFSLFSFGFCIFVLGGGVCVVVGVKRVNGLEEDFLLIYK